jgi:protein associated with RNAse G/E
MSASITVVKCDVDGQEVWSYPGVILEQDQEGLLVEATFDRDLVNVGLMEFVRGDRFLEQYYFRRWFNIFAIYDGQGESLKGWYCNITRPVVFEAGQLRADDLALDYVVIPDGRRQLLDEDEFRALPLNHRERLLACLAFDALRAMIDTHQHPFMLR